MALLFGLVLLGAASFALRVGYAVTRVPWHDCKPPRTMPVEVLSYRESAASPVQAVWTCPLCTSANGLRIASSAAAILAFGAFVLFEVLLHVP
jgi:hypothetical protein